MGSTPLPLFHVDHFLHFGIFATYVQPLDLELAKISVFNLKNHVMYVQVRYQSVVHDQKPLSSINHYLDIQRDQQNQMANPLALTLYWFFHSKVEAPITNNLSKCCYLQHRFIQKNIFLEQEDGFLEEYILFYIIILKIESFTIF